MNYCFCCCCFRLFPLLLNFCYCQCCRDSVKLCTKNPQQQQRQHTHTARQINTHTHTHTMRNACKWIRRRVLLSEMDNIIQDFALQPPIPLSLSLSCVSSFREPLKAACCVPSPSGQGNNSISINISNIILGRSPSSLFPSL